MLTWNHSSGMGMPGFRPGIHLEDLNMTGRGSHLSKFQYLEGSGESFEFSREAMKVVSFCRGSLENPSFGGGGLKVPIEGQLPGRVKFPLPLACNAFAHPPPNYIPVAPTIDLEQLLRLPASSPPHLRCLLLPAEHPSPRARREGWDQQLAHRLARPAKAALMARQLGNGPPHLELAWQTTCLPWVFLCRNSGSQSQTSLVIDFGLALVDFHRSSTGLNQLQSIFG